MSRSSSTFLGYRIYRRKFLFTVIVAVFLSVLAFWGTMFFFVNTWMDDLYQQSQSRFLEKERQLSGIQAWTRDYTDGLYGNAKLLEDAKALFSSDSRYAYTMQRRDNSLSSDTQIAYLPGNVKKLFLDSRSKITGVTIRSDQGMKALYLDKGNIETVFGLKSLEEVRKIPGFGDLLIESCSIRDPEHMSLTMGTLEFWINASDVYDSSWRGCDGWGLCLADGRVVMGSDAAAEHEEALRLAAGQEKLSGWLRKSGKLPFFYAKFDSGLNIYSYVVVKEISEVIRDNRYMVTALLLAFILIGAGVILSSYFSIRADAVFLSNIMDSLSDMEEGHFDRIQERELPVQHKENEYGMIAVALKDVGMKLKGYIETEYILKLKEQETQMRALQHQINPHFLYNTLETLRSKALVHSDRDLADAIAMLGSLYRARMHKTESITLKEEFELLDMYLNIMVLRFEGKFVYQLELDSEIERISTVNFWLQPLAENFFTHGFDQDSEYNLLLVSGHAENGGARIEVSDNGSGAKAALLELIRHNMYEGNDDPKADIGLRNVFMRLNYFYGEGFEMEIGNNAEGGFNISIFIPKKGKLS